LKYVRAFLQVLMILSAAAAVTFAIITYWEQIIRLIDRVRGKIAEKRCAYSFSDPSEYDDYADWDE